ncbi:hypothetical protein BS78_03G398400 [Paspalum vaginatum]|nr:hypothetical protein BS78_03G398400 [Paspalum vaginatum]
MRREAPRLPPLATKLLRAPPRLAAPAILLARGGASFHHGPDGAHHPLDETRSRRAGAIARALAAAASNDASVVACLHCASLKSGAALDPPVRTALVAAYGRARDAGAAGALLREAAAPDVILWNAAIAASTRSRRYGDAVALFRRMARDLGELDATTVVVMLSGASRAGDLGHGMALHGVAAKRCLDAGRVSLWNALVDMYAKCGDFGSSEDAFRSMPCRDATSWNSVISGSVFNGLAEVSAWYFKEMTRSIFRPDEVSLSSVLAACSRLDDLFSFGESVHSCGVKLGYEDTASCSVANSLTTFYSELGMPEAAEKVFSSALNRNLVSWNAMIKGLVDNERVCKALTALCEMTLENQPDVATLVPLISGCGDRGLLSEGKALHGYTIRKGLLHEQSSVGNSLLDLYLKCDEPSAASLLFRTMPTRDLISWNTMISGYSKNDLLREEARSMFKGLLSEGIHCSLTTMLAVIPSCSSLEELSFGKALHSFSLKYGFTSEVSAVNALMHMYISCERIITVSDIVSWNTIIVGCLQNGLYRDALEAFQFIITLVSALSACGHLNLLALGKSIHCMILKRFLASNLRNNKGWRTLQFYQKMEEGFAPDEISIVGIICACTQLGDYIQGKSIHGHVCGRLDTAVSVFEACAEKSIAGWNSMISAFGFHGHGLKAIELFWKMNACSHSGLIDEGWKYYCLMSEKFGIIPTPEHHEAHKFVESLPSQEAHGVWGALLDACSSKSELKMGESIAEHLLYLEPENSGYYVTMSNLYAHRNMWSGAVQVRSILRDKGLVKPHGYSIVG